jgi:hypothetical protein
MAKFRALIAGFCLGLLLIQTIAPLSVRAKNMNKSTFPAEEWFSGGELIEAPADAAAFTTIGEAGEALASSGARVRLSIVSPEGSSQQIVAADVLKGDLVLRLQPGRAAVIRAGETIFNAKPGATVLAGMHEGRASFDASERAAQLIGDWTRKYGESPAMRERGSVSPSTAALRSSLAALKSKSAAFDLITARPIGSLESLESSLINSRLTAGGALLWGNELIEAPGKSAARANFEGLGSATLAGGAQARFVATSVAGAPERRVLSAALVSGAFSIRLQEGVSAVVQAAGSTFVAPRGSRFRILIVEGRAVIDAAGVDLLAIDGFKLTTPDDLWKLAAQDQLGSQTGPPRRYLVRPVGLSSNLVVRARATRQIQVRVTDEDDNPVRGAPVIFLLNSSTGQTIGAVSAGAGAAAGVSTKAFTDSQGVASVSFTAGPVAAAGTVSATVEGTSATWVGQISLTKFVPGFWSAQNAVPIMATVATAGAVGVVKGVILKDEPIPIKPAPGGGTIIRP